MAKAEAVVEKTDAELIAEEVARINARNEAIKMQQEEDAKKGKPPMKTSVDTGAMEAARIAADEALERVSGLHKAKIDGIIASRPKNIVADVHAILNMYSNADYVKISYDDKSGKVTVVI